MDLIDQQMEELKAHASTNLLRSSEGQTTRPGEDSWLSGALWVERPTTTVVFVIPNGYPSGVTRLCSSDQ